MNAYKIAPRREPRSAPQRAHECHHAVWEMNDQIEQNCKIVMAMVSQTPENAAGVNDWQSEKFRLFHHSRQCWEAAIDFAGRDEDSESAENCAKNARIAVEDMRRVYDEVRSAMMALLNMQEHRILYLIREAHRP